jgi:hypothetical protein
VVAGVTDAGGVWWVMDVGAAVQVRKKNGGGNAAP